MQKIKEIKVKKKFELTTNTRIKFGRTLYQIKANISFGSVKEGDLGGWVEKEASLSQEDTCWIYPDAEVFERGIIREGGEIRGGVIWGGEIRGGVIWGGVIRGGVIRGGEIWGGVIWGGEIWGGVIKGGVIWGGEIWGGVIRGGVIRGGEIRNSGDLIVFCQVGSASGVLTAYLVKKEIEVTRGCFRGSIDDFIKAVKVRHGDNQTAKEYALCVELIKLRFSGAPNAKD